MVYIVITWDDKCHGPFDTYEQCYEWAELYSHKPFSIYQVNKP